MPIGNTTTPDLSRLDASTAPNQWPAYCSLFLFEAVELLEQTDLEPAAIDECIRLGVGHPLGVRALLDLVGLDVAQAIGRTIDVPLPGALGRARRGGRARPQERPRPVLTRHLGVV